MGAGIAQAAARAGYSVNLSDSSLERAEAAKKSIEKRLARAVERGKLDADDARACLERIEVRAPSQHGDADLVVEAVVEHLETKLTLLYDLGNVVPNHCLLASNTSSISITRLAASVPRPDCFIGLHFMNPVPVMQLVEIISGLQTSATTRQVATTFAESLDKTVIHSQDRPGFIDNRILIPLLNEACFTLQDHVATSEDIDTGAKLGLHHPMGPLELADLIGLDTVLAIAEVLHREFADSKYRPAPLLKNLVAAGHLGRKTGRGFYVYGAEGK
jgi:3-hydroxybutyryl-CoA dehydrogenase